MTQPLAAMPAVTAILLAWAVFSHPAGAQDVPSTHAPSTHAIAMHGAPKYAADFKHFDYVNPDAPKGGTMRYGAQGSFDTLQGFIPKGEAAEGLGMLYDTLLSASADEAFTDYGALGGPHGNACRPRCPHLSHPRERPLARWPADHRRRCQMDL